MTGEGTVVGGVELCCFCSLLLLSWFETVGMFFASGSVLLLISEVFPLTMASGTLAVANCWTVVSDAVVEGDEEDEEGEALVVCMEISSRSSLGP